MDDELDLTGQSCGSMSRVRIACWTVVSMVHHFRDNALDDLRPPFEKVVVFDEAQRAWNQEQTSSFMRTKKQIDRFSQSEPEFLIDVMDRHQDWCVIVCLIGGGQEINKGEAGLLEWFSAIKNGSSIGKFMFPMQYLTLNIQGDLIYRAYSPEYQSISMYPTCI